jgi:S-adenosylmethionine synthetase
MSIKEQQSFNYFFTSESVSEGHPDKIADRISDGVLDHFLSADNEARVAVETLVTTNKVIIAGEIKPTKDVESFNKANNKEAINILIKDIIKDIGYDQDGFSYKNVSIENYLHSQSQDIAIGVDATSDKEEGAGDQGIMFGFACDETIDYMPTAIYYSHKILETLSEKRKSNEFSFLEPDAKSQITVEYRNNKPVSIDTVVVSHQHKQDASYDLISSSIKSVLTDVLPPNLYNAEKAKHYINPTGRFVIGGPDGDTGLTGRKIIVDTYGGMAPHGGGAFSGKDPTKVDRSAAYIARHIAKNIVASGISSMCTIQLSYAIGISKPTSIYINTHNTEKVDTTKLPQLIQEIIDLSPKGIRTYLKLNNPIYSKTSSYGHFGRKANGLYFPWEDLGLSVKLKSYYNL